MIETLKNHISENIKQYLVLFIILAFGVMIGSITVNNTTEIAKAEISEYLNTFVTDVTENKINYFAVLQNSVIKNIELVLIIAFISLSVLGKIGIYIINGYKGFTLGYTISSFIAVFGIQKGVTTSMSLLLFSKIIYIPALFFLSIHSLKLYQTLKENDGEDKKVAIIKYIFIIIAVVIALIISSLIETFINSNLLLVLLGGNK